MPVSNFMQMTIWAALFVLLCEFESFAKSLYFSGVTYRPWTFEQ